MECNCCNVFMFCIINCVSDISGITPIAFICLRIYILCFFHSSETILLVVLINCDYILDGHTSLYQMHSVPTV